MGDPVPGFLVPPGPAHVTEQTFDAFPRLSRSQRLSLGLSLPASPTLFDHGEEAERLGGGDG